MDDNHACTSQTIILKSKNKSIRPTNCPGHHQIHVDFICDTVIFHAAPQHPAVFLETEERGTAQASTAAIINSDDKAYLQIRGLIYNVLRSLWSKSDHITDFVRQWLIEQAVNEACEILSTNNTSYVSVSLEFQVLLQHNHIHHRRGGVRNTVPPPPMLKKYDVGSGKRIAGESCRICLEDLEEFSDGLLCMPCHHVFHGECIERWLSTSRHCPLCRYELSVDFRLFADKDSRLIRLLRKC